jgi:hypothetical protein
MHCCGNPLHDLAANLPLLLPLLTPLLFWRRNKRKPVDKEKS